MNIFINSMNEENDRNIHSITLSQELHQLLRNQHLTDFLDEKKGFVYPKSGGSDKNMNLNCTGLLE